MQPSDIVKNIRKPQDSRIDYGADAPELIRMFCLISILLIAVGALLIISAPSRWVAWCGTLILVGALAPLTMGIMMSLYAWRGKLRMRDWVLSRHPWRGNETVLDIGAGRGLMTIGAGLLVPQGTVHAMGIWRAEDLTDTSEPELRKSITTAGLHGNVQIHTMDARCMSFADSSIDVVLSLLCLHNIEGAADRQGACREIARVLKPGGVAYIADFTATRSYAEAFRAQGLQVKGPINAIPVALSLMFLVEARKPLA